jgi:hypothetical protein
MQLPSDEGVASVPSACLPHSVAIRPQGPPGPAYMPLNYTFIL